VRYLHGVRVQPHGRVQELPARETVMLCTAAGTMVSAAAEAALHHHADDDGIEQREALAAASMVHSLTASCNLMAALSPLDPPPSFGDAEPDSGRAYEASSEDVGNGGAVSLPLYWLISWRAQTTLQNTAASALRPQPTAALLYFQAPAAGDMGLQFRLYRQTSGNRALLQRVALPQHTLDKVQHLDQCTALMRSLLR
jgi:hypothetical protein